MRAVGTLARATISFLIVGLQIILFFGALCLGYWLINLKLAGGL